MARTVPSFSYRLQGVKPRIFLRFSGVLEPRHADEPGDFVATSGHNKRRWAAALSDQPIDHCRVSGHCSSPKSTYGLQAEDIPVRNQHAPSLLFSRGRWKNPMETG